MRLLSLKAGNPHMSMTAVLILSRESLPTTKMGLITYIQRKPRSLLPLPTSSPQNSDFFTLRPQPETSERNFATNPPSSIS